MTLPEPSVASSGGWPLAGSDWVRRALAHPLCVIRFGPSATLPALTAGSLRSLARRLWACPLARPVPRATRLYVLVET